MRLGAALRVSVLLSAGAASLARAQWIEFLDAPPDQYAGTSYPVRLDMGGGHGLTCIEWDIVGNCITFQSYDNEVDPSFFQFSVDGLQYPSGLFATSVEDSGCQNFSDGTYECRDYFFATGVATFAAGLRRFDAAVMCRGSDCAGTYQTTTYGFNATAPTLRGVAVRAELTKRQQFAAASATQRFFIKNRGNVSATYTLAWQCTGGVIGCAVSPTSVPLGPGESSVATLSYTAGSPSDTGTGMVKAVDNAASTTRDSAGVALNVIGAPFPLVSVVDGNPGTTVERDACLTIAAGAAAAFECGDLRVVHALPVIRTVSKVRVPTLLYNSAVAEPYPVIAASVTLASGASRLPDSVEAVLTVAGGERARARWAGSDWAPGATRRIALGYSAAGDTTGVYPYTFEVATIYLGSPGSRNGTIATGELIVINRRGAAFGGGWWLAGVERLKPLPDGRQLWVGGDGSARVYLPAGTNVWVAGKFDRPDTLKKVQTGQYYRTVKGGATVWFSAVAGKHDSTVNRLGYKTTFTYADTFLTRITLPTQGGGQLYTFTYDSTTLPPPRRIVRVVAPASRTTTIWLGSQRLDSISDPDNQKVRFTFENASSRRIATRTDRRVTVTSYSYDSAKKLVRAQVNLQPDSIRLGFRARDVQGLATALPKTATDTAIVYTAFDGPRQFTTGPNYIAQETKFWLDAFGAPRRILNAVGDSTLIRREDGEWPGLATTVIVANGFVTRAWYDARGNVAQSIAVNPLGDGQNAPTRYHWDPKWDALDSIVTPSGITTFLVYDGSNGNRLVQQVGSDIGRRVAFRYNAQQLLASTVLPQTAPDSVAYDGQLNLAATRTPKGFWTSYYKDPLGRDTLVVTPIDSLESSRWPGGAQDSTARLRQHTVYTVMDRDSITESIAPNRAQLARVEKRYDFEGNLVSLARSSTPDASPPIGTITTQWRYDRANRRVAEVAPDGQLDSTDYDPAGNAVVAVSRRTNPTSGARLVDTLRYDALNRLTERRVPEVHYGQRLDGIPKNQWGATVPNTPYPFYPNDGGSGYLVAADVAAFTYDSMGRLRTANNGAARIARGYYPSGAIKADTQWIRTVSGSDFDQHRYILQYRYDLDGRPVDLIHPAQLAAGALRDRTTYAYDPSTGLLATVTDLRGDVFQLGYDQRGQLTSLTLPGGISESYEYDADGGLRTQRLLNGSSSAYRWPESYLRNASYGHDATGRTTYVYNRAGTADTLFAQYSGLGGLVRDSMRTRGQASVVYPTGGVGPFPIRYDAIETFTLDALGNARQTVTNTRAWNGDVSSTGTHTRIDAYVAGVGRLAAHALDSRVDTLVYDEAGNTIWMSTVRTFDPTQDRASYYGADGKLAAADRRSLPSYRSNFEESRYDALGRRVWVRSRNSCTSDPLCRNSKIRRTVWDGDHELYEIQMPGGDADGAWFENDVAQVTLPVVISQENGLPYDLNVYFGRVAYTTGLTIDQPLSIIRFGYRSVMDQNGNAQPALDWAPFALMPRWTTRGLADIGTFEDGGVDRCTTFQGVQRCIWVDWPAQVYAYARNEMRRNAWHGTVPEDKGDAAGTYYRRARLYDPATGRFTQEDPIGLAGGLNLYGFASGDPINFSDPFGLCPLNLDAANAFLCNSIEAVGTGAGFLLGFVAGGGTGALETVGTGGALAPLAVAQTVAASGIGAAAGLSAAQRLTSVLFASSEPNRSSGRSRTSANQMQKQIERGQAPKSATRVDVGKVAGEQEHIHFGDEDALNADGTWKHGGRSLTNAEQDWLLRNGWNVPE